jgi:hypothetical protein
MAVLTVEVDFAEQRLTVDRMAALVDGNGWDMDASDPGVFLDFVTRTILLTPVQFNANWLTTGTGAYARYGKPDYLLTTPDSWREHDLKFSGDTYLHALNTNEVVYTGATFDKNRGVFLSWFAYNAGNDGFLQMQCGWDEGGAAEVSLNFYAGGQVEVYRNGALAGTGNLTTLQNYPQEAVGGQQQANQTIDVLLIPCRRRELLILSNQGGGFNVRFEDIDEYDDDPTITGPGRFWWQVPEGQATVQFAPARYATSGYALSAVNTWRFAPLSGQTHTEEAYYDEPGYGSGGLTATLVETDGSTTFVPDDSNDQSRIRVDLTGDGESTLFLYGASSVFAAQVGNTVDDPTTIDAYLTGCEWDVPDDPENVSLTLTVTDPNGVEALGATELRTQANRNVRASIGAVAILTGRVARPEWRDSANSEAAEIILACRDYAEVFERYRINDPTPFDGLTVTEAIETLCGLPGFADAAFDVDTIDYILPSIGSNSKGEWALLPEVGDTVGEWIRRLWETYARNCLYGWKPTASGPVFGFYVEADMSTVADVTLYGTQAESVSVGGYPAGTWGAWYRQYDEQPLPAEANEVRVIGRDPRTKLPIFSTYIDYAAQDPTTAVASRPVNWWGEPLKYAWIDESITTQEDANYCLGVIQPRLTSVRTMAEWEADFLLKNDGAAIWRGDVVTLYGRGRFRVRALSGRTEVEGAETLDEPERVWRPTRYIGEYLGA